MNTFHNFESLENALQRSDGVMSVQMGQLREACGAGRLGIHVRASIADELDNRGIGYHPPILPNNQSDFVRLYKKGTAVSEIIEAFIAIGDTKADEILRELQRRIPVRTGAVKGSQTPALSEPMADLLRSLDRAESRPGNHFVALKWFRDVALAADEPETSKSNNGRDALLREAIQRGVVLTSKVPNPVKPQFPVTSIHLNRSAPEVQAALRAPIKPGTFQPVPIRGETLSATVLKDRR